MMFKTASSDGRTGKDGDWTPDGPGWFKLDWPPTGHAEVFLILQHGKATLAVYYRHTLDEEAAGVKGVLAAPKPRI